MGYVQKFKEKFPDKVTPEMTEAFHSSKSKISEFTTSNMREHDDEVAGIFFLSEENSARKKGPYVTKAMLKLNRMVTTLGPPRRADIIYMITNAPKKDEILKKFDSDPREAYFKATDHVLNAGTANNCYRIIAQEFYKDHPKEFAKNMVHIRYDAVALSHGDKIVSYIVFNSDCIQIVNQ
jgi:hypothetical protein